MFKEGDLVRVTSPDYKIFEQLGKVTGTCGLEGCNDCFSVYLFDHAERISATSSGGDTFSAIEEELVKVSLIEELTIKSSDNWIGMNEAYKNRRPET